MRRLELDILFWCTRAAILIMLPLYVSDTVIYQGYAGEFVREHHIPFRDFHFEYPPLAYLLLVLPALLQKALGWSSLESYRVLFGFFLLPFDFLLYWSFRLRPPFRGAAFAYILLTSALFLLLFDRFDIVIGFLLVWPFLRPRPKDSHFVWCWGLGGALKLVPLALLPLLLLWRECWNRTQIRRSISQLAGGFLPAAGSLGLAAWLGGGKIDFLTHHSQRGVQVESLAGSLVMASKAFLGKLPDVKVSNDFGAQHLGGIAWYIQGAHAVFWGSLLLSAAWIFLRRKRLDRLSSAWLFLSGFVTFGYVLSPQFLLWLLPLGLCVAGRVDRKKRAVWITLFALAVVLTGLHFRFYWNYVALQKASVLMVLLRNLTLVGLWGWSWSVLQNEVFSAKLSPMTPHEAQKLLLEGQAVLVDVREADELEESGTAEGALWMPMSKMHDDEDDWQKFKQQLPKDKPVILYCKVGGRSARMAEFLSQAGFQAVNLGCFKDWKSAGLPVRPFRSTGKSGS